MPDVQILTASSGFKSQDTSTWATVCQIPAGSFTAGDKYLIIATAHSMLNDSAQELHMRLVHGTTPRGLSWPRRSLSPRAAAEKG